MIPETQLESFKALQGKLNSRQNKVLIVFFGGAYAGFEVARRLGWELYRTLPRITELQKCGLLQDSGERKVNPDSGRNVIVWELGIGKTERMAA